MTGAAKAAACGAAKPMLISILKCTKPTAPGPTARTDEESFVTSKSRSSENSLSNLRPRWPPLSPHFLADYTSKLASFLSFFVSQPIHKSSNSSPNASNPRGNAATSTVSKR